MLACLFGAYINNYFKEYLGMSYTEAIRYITPIVEETIKLLPAILFVVIFLPKDSDILTFLAALGVGFATFENACYIIENGTDSIIFVLIRGASAGTMHVVSGLIGGVGLAFAKRFKPVMIVGTITVLTVSVTFHGMYNLLVSARGVLMYIGFAMPLSFHLMTEATFWSEYLYSRLLQPS